MKHYKKYLNAFVAILLAVGSLYFFSQKASAETYTGTLNHNTYVYNKNGKRKTSYRKLLKGEKITLVGNVVSRSMKWPYVKNPSDDTPLLTGSKYYFIDNSDQKNVKVCYLTYRTIKKQPYYSLGKGNYIRVANIEKIGKFYQLITETTVTLKKKTHLYNSQGDQLNQIVKKGSKFKVDALINLKDYNVSSRVYCFYRIKGTQRYIYATDVKRPRIDLNWAYVK